MTKFIEVTEMCMTKSGKYEPIHTLLINTDTIYCFYDCDGIFTEITFKCEYEKGVKTIDVAESFEKIKKMLAIPEN
ncbi:MAG: hypothetical protein II663_01700 [Bacteroidales bacterium]|nr:hypothetical protein [Bacteroidales bacterium]